VFDNEGNQVQSRTWTRILWRNYPLTIQDWISRNGGLTPRMIFLRGKELAAMYPLCTEPGKQAEAPDRIATPPSSQKPNAAFAR
jgi:hypothetical protein